MDEQGKLVALLLALRSGALQSPPPGGLAGLAASMRAAPYPPIEDRPVINTRPVPNPYPATPLPMPIIGVRG